MAFSMLGRAAAARISTALSNTRGATLGAIRNTGTLTGNIDNQGQLGAISNTGTLAGDITNTGVISTLTNTSTGTLGAIVNMETGRLAGGIDNAGLINARTAILNVGSG